MNISATGAKAPFKSRPKQNPFLKKKSQPSLNNYARIKRKRDESDEDEDEAEKLPQIKIITSLRSVPTSDILEMIQHAKNIMFMDIPERLSGMNSKQIADILNFRKNLPPLVSLAHIYAISKSTTSTDREIASLLQQGIIRKISIIGRGKGGAPLGDGLIKTDDWIEFIHNSNLSGNLQNKYISLLKENKSQMINSLQFDREEIPELVSSGFITLSSALSNHIDVRNKTGQSIADNSIIAPTGSIEAVGGQNVIQLHGNISNSLTTNDDNKIKIKGNLLTFSLPNTGIYLKLITEAKQYLLSLIIKMSPKYKEGLKDLLRERWDGNTPTVNDNAKRIRGDWTGVILPGRTKKWKDYYGLTFEFILNECLGSGAVECFETGSVGLGVRIPL